MAALALTAAVGGLTLQVAGVGLQQLDSSPLAESTAWPLEEAVRGDAVPAGRYAAPFIGDDVEPGPWAQLDVPNGFAKGEESTLHAIGKGRRLGLWMVASVNTNPCHSVDFADPGPSVRDLATALAAQPVLRSTEPVPVSLGGFDGLYLEQRVPAGLHWRDCVTYMGSPRRDNFAPPVPMFYFDSWRAPGVGANGSYAPGQTHQVWILDVDGHRLVVDAAFGSDATVEQQRQLTRMVESIRFTRPPPAD